MAKVKLEAVLGKNKSKKTIYSKSNFQGPMDVLITQTIDGVKSEFYPLKQLAVVTAPPANIPPVVDAGEDAWFDEGTVGIVLDGSALDTDGRIVRAAWKQTQGTPVTLTPFADDNTKAIFDAPSLAGSDSVALLFEFEAEDDKAEISKDSCIITIGKEITPPPPPPLGVWPLPNVQMYYSSDSVLSHDGTFPTKKRSPFDPVLLFSNASGVQSHKVANNWLTINTGQQYGRVYWELYELPEFNTTKLGQVTVMAGVFKIHDLGNDCDFSVKLGDHGTTGYSYDGKTFFGGFGVSFHAGEIQSKCEWKHGTPEGHEDSAKYLGGKKLEAGKAYPYFITWVADEAKNTMTLNVWIDFGTGFELTMKDRVWEKDSEWDSKCKSIPSDALDYDEVQKGPAFIKSNHCWTRANQGNIDVQHIQLGCLV